MIEEKASPMPITKKKSKYQQKSAQRLKKRTSINSDFGSRKSGVSRNASVHD
jgi:hypothetical protein